jgi:hypothetical protein
MSKASMQIGAWAVIRGWRQWPVEGRSKPRLSIMRKLLSC